MNNLYFLITIRELNINKILNKVIDNGIVNLISNLENNLISNIIFSIAIDSRSNATINEKNELSIELEKLLKIKSIIYKASNPGKSAAQREFSKKYCKDNDYILISDFSTEIILNENENIKELFSSEKYSCTIFPVQFSSLEKRKKLSGYFTFENRLRQFESKKSLCFTGSGQLLLANAFAFKSLPDDVGDDCFLPLFLNLNGYSVLYSNSLKALEESSYKPIDSLKARRRMIIRNLPYTLFGIYIALRKKRINLTITIMLHKLIKWFSPHILLLCLIIFTKSKIVIIVLLSILLSLINIRLRTILLGSLGFLIGSIECLLLGKRIKYY
tara:strand:- start:122 stop:1108 length:987 start_codon:yes stop_codon:yes gene_type:complete